VVNGHNHEDKDEAGAEPAPKKLDKWRGTTSFLSEDELFANIGASGHKMTDLEKAFMRFVLSRSRDLDLKLREEFPDTNYCMFVWKAYKETKRAVVAYAERAEAGAEDAQLEAKLREIAGDKSDESRSADVEWCKKAAEAQGDEDFALPDAKARHLAAICQWCANHRWLHGAPKQQCCAVL